MFIGKLVNVDNIANSAKTVRYELHSSNTNAEAEFE